MRGGEDLGKKKGIYVVNFYLIIILVLNKSHFVLFVFFPSQ